MLACADPRRSGELTWRVSGPFLGMGLGQGRAQKTCVPPVKVRRSRPACPEEEVRNVPQGVPGQGCAPFALRSYLRGAGYMNFSGLLLSRAFLMWLRPTPLAPAGKEGRTLEPGSGGARAPLQLHV